LLIGIIAALFATVSVSVSGTATLPNGITAQIVGPFSCSETKGLTTIEVGGRVFTFTNTDVTVDKIPIANIDSSIADVKLESSHSAASLYLNGKQIKLPR